MNTIQKTPHRSMTRNLSLKSLHNNEEQDSVDDYEDSENKK
jgi:hypothetical protein